VEVFGRKKIFVLLEKTPCTKTGDLDELRFLLLGFSGCLVEFAFLVVLSSVMGKFLAAVV
jgi:hypothetical protein